MEATTFVLFGATGDLAKRKIYPALYNLYVDGKLPQKFAVIGLGRREFSDHVFQSNVEKAVQQFSRRKPEDTAVFNQFLKAFHYVALNIDYPEDYQKLLSVVEQQEGLMGGTPNRMFYLSVGPEFFETIANNIKASGLGDTKGWKRLLIEKPFGHDLQSARELNHNLSHSFQEDEIYRIDHYLGKPMIQKLESLQQGNPIIQALWSNRNISNVQITASETVGVEERAGYYDHVGAIRDMFQNHMLQMLSMLTLHLPQNSTPDVVRFKKKTIMESLEPIHDENVNLNIIRGQYSEGVIDHTPVVGYTSEIGIPATSVNDTFIAAKIEIDDTFWRGVPFYIRTGKRMKEKFTRIVIEFKEALQQSTKTEVNKDLANLLILEISPNEGITFRMNTKDEKNKNNYQPMYLDFYSSGNDAPEAYENIIYDAFNGDPTFFAHWDEVELSWEWVQPILNAYEKNIVPLHRYPAGSNGPKASDELLAKDGNHWWLDPEPVKNIEEIKGGQYVYTN